MKTVAVEIRDRMTFIPAVAVVLRPDTEEERFLLRRCGYDVLGRPAVLLLRLADGSGTSDPHGWGRNDRTMSTAHRYLAFDADLDRLASGEVVDVEFILGETNVRKESERWG